MREKFIRIKSIILSKRLLFSVLGCLIILFIWSNYKVKITSEGFVTNNIEQLPATKVGLLLGTSASLKNGNQNPFFRYRIEAVMNLYKEGKIEKILISGDNGTKAYNEPEDMKMELMRRGVPEAHIVLDYAGFDTYDSVVRADKIFGQKQFIVVSQAFHNERAVYIAREKGYNVYGYNAKDVSAKRSLLTHTREYFARVKAFIEVSINVDPYFLGDPVNI